MIKIKHFFNGKEQTNKNVVVEMTQDTRGAHVALAEIEKKYINENRKKRKQDNC